MCIYIYITFGRGKTQKISLKSNSFASILSFVISKALSRGWGQQTKSLKGKLKQKLDKAKTKVKNERRGRLAKSLKVRLCLCRAHIFGWSMALFMDQPSDKNG